MIKRRHRAIGRSVLVVALFAAPAGAVELEAIPADADTWIRWERIDPVVSDVSLHVNAIEPKRVVDAALTKSLKGPETDLVRRLLLLREEVRGWEVVVRPFSDRTLERYFPNTEFFRLFARSGSVETSIYGCIAIGQALVLPDDFTFLLVLENRKVNRHNIRPLAELVVRMVDPEGPTTMNVIKHTILRDSKTEEIERIELESWSYNSRLKKRWRLDVRGPFFHMLEEKVLSIRPPVLDGLKPLDLNYVDDDEIVGPAAGDERYISFWRDPAERREMNDVRRRWREARVRAREAAMGDDS